MADMGLRTADEIAGECLAVRLRMLNRVVTNVYDDALRPLGIKVSQMNVLVVVARKGPISPGAIAETLQMEKSTISRNIERMVPRGWLATAPGESGRDRLVRLTAKGEKLLIDALPLWRQAQTDTHRLLGERGAAAVDRMAKRVWSGKVDA